MAHPSNTPKKSEDKPVKKTNTFMTGAQRYSDIDESTTKDNNTNRKLQIVIKQAKSSGKLDISSRGLTQIPEEVLKM